MAKSDNWKFTSSGKQTTSYVASIVKTVNNMHGKLHIAAVSCVLTRMVHGNTEPMRLLMTGLSGKSIHVAGLKKWFEDQGGVTISLDDKKQIKVACKKLPLQTDEEAMRWAKDAPTFWSYAPPPDAFKGFNYAEELAKLNKKAAEMARALTEGTIKRKGEVIELTEDDIALINLDGYRPTVSLDNSKPEHGITAH